MIEIDCPTINNIVRQRGRNIDWKLSTVIFGQIGSREADTRAVSISDKAFS